MNKLKAISAIRRKLKRGQPSIGSWMQIPHGSVAEIMGASGFDWVAVDMEHGSISVAQLPDLFRALELGCTLPLARISNGTAQNCKEALDAGAAGVIVPNIQNAQQLIEVRDACRWPPAGKRGVGFCRANLFGRNFLAYGQEAQAPFLVAMIEDFQAVKALEEILAVNGLDAILVGPYDLSASTGCTGDFRHQRYKNAYRQILRQAKRLGVPAGIHVIQPSVKDLIKQKNQGFSFIAYSIDSVLLENGLKIKNFESLKRAKK